MPKQLPTFVRYSRSFDEDVLYSWAEGAIPIGPQLGYSDLPESVLKALAEFHLTSKKAAKEEAIRAQERLKQYRDMKWKWLGIGASAVAAVGGAVIAGLKALGLI